MLTLLCVVVVFFVCFFLGHPRSIQVHSHVLEKLVLLCIRMLWVYVSTNKINYLKMYLVSAAWKEVTVPIWQMSVFTLTLSVRLSITEPNDKKHPVEKQTDVPFVRRGEVREQQLWPHPRHFVEEEGLKLCHFLLLILFNGWYNF